MNYNNPQSLPVLQPPTFYLKLQQQKKMIKQLKRPTTNKMIPATITPITTDNKVLQSNIPNINWRKDIKKFRVRLYILGQRVLLGNFDNLLDATECLHCGLKFKNYVESIERK